MTNTSSRNLEIRRPRGWLATTCFLAGAMILGAAGCKGRTTPTAPTSGAVTAPTSAATGECASLATSSPHKFEPGNYWKHEITVLRDQHDLQACAQACVANPDCKVATFVDSSAAGDYRNTCVLRSQVGERHPEEQGMCSWVKS